MSGTFAITAQVTDNASPTRVSATKSLSIVVAPAALTISTSSLPGVTVGTAYAQTLAATGGVAPYTWSLSTGALPTGLSLNTTTGAITGTPTASGTFAITAQVTDNASPTRVSTTQALSIVVAPAALTISTSSLPGVTIGTAYAQTLAATGGVAPYTWSLSTGALPTGLSLNTTTGAITGTPTVSGTFAITVQVTDNASPTRVSATKALSIVVAPAALTISTSSLPGVTIGTAYSQTLAATGGVAPYTWSLSTGALPTGLSLNTTTGAITGTPTVAGTSAVTAQVTDSASPIRVSSTRALSIVVAPASQTTLSVTSPSPNAVVSGNLTFSVTLQGQAAYVEYLLNGKTFSGPLGIAPYSYPFATATFWDGPASVQAIARDGLGNELSRSSVVNFRIANAPSSTVSATIPGTAGLVNWSTTATTPSGVEGITFIVDGGFKDYYQTVVPYDTTKLSNGPHEFFNGFYSAGSGRLPVGMAQTVMTVNNGHSPRALLPAWRTLFLTPNQTTSLSPRILYTDDQYGAASGVTYVSANPQIATVDSTGTVKGIAVGSTTITLSSGGLSAQVLARVSTTNAFQHLAKDGQILTAYDANRSIFVRSVFGLSSDEINGTPGLGLRAQQAGINALTEGFYQNPADNPQPSLTAWQNSFQSSFNAKALTASQNNMSLYLIGDDIARTAAEMNNSIAGPWSAAALQFAFKTLRDSKRVIAVDMVDEVNFLWGPTPKPTGTPWATYSPSIPSNAFTTLMTTINQVAGRPPVSWPVAGLSGSTDVQNWLGDPTLSDFTSHYWTILDWRSAYPTGPSVPQYKSNMDTAVVNRLPFIQADKPAVVLGQLAGPFYTKRGSGAEYVPGQDFLQDGGTSPVGVAASTLYAAAMGQAGIRVYHYDSSQWKYQRSASVAGQNDLQTGSDPFTVGTDRWLAMASAFNLIKRIEPHLLQPSLHSPELGPLFVSGAHQGPWSRLLLAVNMSEGNNTTTVDLSPYLYAGNGSIMRFRVQEASGKVERISSTTSDTVTFGPGEGIAWLFTATPEAGPAVRISQPLNGATVAGTVTLLAESTDSPARVDFLVDGTVVGSASSAPYSITWNASSVTPNKSHSIVARAYNSQGGSEDARIRLVTR